MLRSLSKNSLPLIIVLFHITLGALMTLPVVPKLYGISIVFLGIIFIVFNKNKNQEALLFSAYLVGAEVFLRMTSGIILYETGKYGILIFLFLGAWFGKNNNTPNVLFVFYLLFLLIGITFTTVPEGESLRKSIAFNLSGPFLLGIAAIYFYKRNMSLDSLYKALKMMLLPIIAMSSYLYFRTPSIDEIIFRSNANFKASGGFGPNQVATVLGLGVFVVAVFLLTKRKLSGFVILDTFILFYLLYRGLITFSRGGIITAFIAFIVFITFYLYAKKTIYYLKIIGIASIVGIGIWVYISDLTGGMLTNRYLGVNEYGVLKKDITSGRLKILNSQINNFIENPIFGIGVGNGKYQRNEISETIPAASHNEMGRLLEEHGLIGVLSLLLLLISPVSIFIRINYFQRAFLASFFIFWFLTINHSAMRIAFPSFIYGLSLITIKDD